MIVTPAFVSVSAATSTSPTIDTLPSNQSTGIWQVDMTSTGTVKLKGRLVSSADWIDIETKTASGASTVTLWAQMQVEITANGGVIDSWLMH